ncbi:MAG: hypothetical protein NVV57_02045 [Demequina sp.]|jgi:hypothetical protein|nr:hypothetical protein [Demequina sp.]
MTAISVAPPITRRIGTTARVHLANPWALIYTPAIITLGVFALNYSIWRIVIFAADGHPLDPHAFDYNGGVTWVMFYLVVVAVQAMNQTFSFTVGLGSTRKDYYAGTAIVFVCLALGFGVGIAAMAGLERLTDGWGVDGHFFAPGFLQTLPVWELAAMYSLALLLLTFVGAAAGAMFVRWAATGVIVFFGILAVLAVAVVYLLVAARVSGEIISFFADRSPLELAAMTLPITAVAAVAGFLILRRATPKG